ncbi:oxygenase MpaB family protein [Hufsiella ginkgonis]|uniref:DUF2236 domain-containing protein n=1 Tax=Hufsiella ginkgonis TaxID=2695274 RepID=A0A7K1XYC0_9SPHI|nr:oxygenase MpaB family protein [Hufsiella ginkgonis]MXV15991.1 DUF2236 domain-containing protein [Hufsiella ginkgonis]
MVAVSWSTEFLSSQRVSGDDEADRFIETQFTDTSSKLAFQQWLNSLGSNEALRHLPAAYQCPPVSPALQLPAWANRHMMANGAAFFAKHAEQIMQLLGLLSLPYCYAAADGAKVLHLSQRLTHDAGKRLTDTASFVWDVLSPRAFAPGGKGFTAILKIRLTHAAGRYYLLRAGTWDFADGYPINQEDMAGTNLAFSLIVIRGLRKLGHSISYADQQAFLHLWNVIGSLMGIREPLITHDGKSANLLEQAIRTRHFKASEHGRELTRSLTAYFTGAISSRVTEKEIRQLMRYLLGDEPANLLGIDEPVPVHLPYLLRINSAVLAFTPGETADAAWYRKSRTFQRR